MKATVCSTGFLGDAGLGPSPERSVETRDTFARRHAATLWVSNFLAVRTATRGGFVDASSRLRCTAIATSRCTLSPAA
ncbi:unnamed protein product [Gemmataceae bacterium]|nr:unnamed protein product [Gemmataceae bacterium]VTU02564.1 unnamed protein product [Gemmataceae bacterium]